MKKNVTIFMMKQEKKNKLMIMASVSSVLTTVCLIVLKIIGFLGTGSVAVLSSLLDSVQDCMTALINMVAVKQAVQPPDKAHRFGHGKAQGIGSLLQAVIIGFSAIWLMVESVGHLMYKSAVHDVKLGVWVIFISIIITFCLVRFQNYVIRMTGALSIKTDRAHYAGDLIMNLGVLLSLCISSKLSVVWFDAVFGICVSFYLCYTIWGIMKEACAVLMDKELPQSIRQDIRSLIISTPLVKNVSSFKSREGGNKKFVQFNVQFDGDIALKTVHEELDIIETKIQSKYPNMDIIIHAEPFDETKQRKGKI